MARVFAICFRASTSSSMFNQKKIYDFLSFSPYFTEYFGPDFMRILWFVKQIDESLWTHIYRCTTINLIQLREIVKRDGKFNRKRFIGGILSIKCKTATTKLPPQKGWLSTKKTVHRRATQFTGCCRGNFTWRKEIVFNVRSDERGNTGWQQSGNCLQIMRSLNNCFRSWPICSENSNLTVLK